jgi:hypothetical protein
MMLPMIYQSPLKTHINKTPKISGIYKKHAPQWHFLPMVRTQHDTHGEESLGVEPKDGIIFLTF